MQPSTLQPKPLTDPDTARSKGRFLVFGLLLGVGSIFGQTYFFGILQPVIRTEYGWSAAEFGRIYLLVTLGSALGLALVGHWIDRLALPRYILILSVALGASVLLLSASINALLLIMAMTLMRMLGQGLMVHAAMTSMSRYFDTMRGRAIAIAGTGVPIGQAIVPPLAVILIADLGWRTAVFWSGLTFLIIMVPLLQFLLRGHAARHARWLAHQSDSHGSSVVSSRSLRRSDMIRDWRFYLFVPVLFLTPFWITAFFFFADQIASYKDLSLQNLTSYYWVFAVGGVLVPLLAGSLVDRIGGKKLLAVPSFFMIGAMLALMNGTHQPGIVLYMVLLGVAGGMAVPINNALWAELYGTRYLGEIKALVNALTVVSTALAPALIGELIERSASMDTLLYFAICHAVFSVPLALMVGFFMPVVDDPA